MIGKVTDLVSSGWVIREEIPLPPGGPFGGDRGLESEEKPTELYIPSSELNLFGSYMQDVMPESVRHELAQARGRGETPLLTREDYVKTPVVRRFNLETRSVFRDPRMTLDEFARTAVGAPDATWAISSPPSGERPVLFILRPAAQLLAEDPTGASAVFGEPRGTGDGTVRQEEDAVYIGGIRVERRKDGLGYVMWVDAHAPEESGRTGRSPISRL